jgi:dihydroorotate dehydrogenase (NAD+) catalytic subunit
VSDVLATRVGEVALSSAILTAAGTAGYGDELAGYGELSELGAVVTKSLAAFAWPGNPAPRVAAAGDVMLNAVGLAGPGVEAWRREHLVHLRARGARVVASIWGRTVEEFAAAAAALRGADVLAVELNASCPNLESRASMFAHSAEATARIVEATAAAGVPRWVKLSPNTPELVEIAGAAIAAGADALVLTNTLLGLSIDVETGRASLGNGGGGVSGPAIFPVALRAVYDCRAAYPHTPIVGVGGVASARDVVAMVMAGADAVEVGTAIFADPRAPWRIQRSLRRWLRRHSVSTLRELQGRAHESELR